MPKLVALGHAKALKGEGYTWLAHRKKMISHYTSISALAHVLQSKRIRFSRLDGFDDIQEAQVVAGINFGSQLFASCWVREEREDIPQWAMYGDRMSGVRISLPEDPFKWRLLHGVYPVPGCQASWEFDQVYLPFSVDDLRGDGYIITPELLLTDSFLQDVIYVDDVSAAYSRHVEQVGTSMIIRPHASYLARYKSSRWSFQRECRFVVSTKRGPQACTDEADYGVQYMKLVADPEWGKLGALAQHVDVELGDQAFDHLKLTMGPLASVADYLIVEALLAKYAPKAMMRRSELTDLIRPR